MLSRSQLTCILLIVFLLTIACLSSPTPAPGEIVNMDNVCQYGGQVMEVEGQLILPSGVSCTSEEPFTCQIYLVDPFSGQSITINMPVSNDGKEIPANHMAALPETYALNDFYVHTADGRYARNRSFVSVRGMIAMGSRNQNCSFSQIETITWLDRLLYAGMDLTRVTLQEALTEGLVVASITGNGLTQINLTLKPKVEVNLEIEIAPGTLFISGTEGVQNMVVRQREIVYLKPTVEMSLELEVSCANMHLKQPEFSDVFTISSEPTNEDLLRLLALEDFAFYDTELQQFAIWTITDNPFDPYSYVPIEVGGYTHYPQEYQIDIIKDLFEAAGIDTTKFKVFAY